MSDKRRILIAVVRDEPGVLARIATTFRRRGLNLASLAVGKSETVGFSRMTFVVEGMSPSLASVEHHLERLIDVLSVTDVTEQNAIARELALLKVGLTPETLGAINNIASLFAAKTLDLQDDVVTFELTGTTERVSALVRLLSKFDLKSVSRTGVVVCLRGEEDAQERS